MKILNGFASILFVRFKISNCMKKLKFIASTMIIFTSFFHFSIAPARIVDPEAIRIRTTHQAKIEAYKEFKKQYEDKDFGLKNRFLTRTRTQDGKSVVSRIAIYSIEYGITADNRSEYSRNCSRIVRNPTRQESSKIPNCQKPFYVERYGQTGLDPQISCFDVDALSYPVALMFDVFSEADLKSIVLITEFGDGDLEIQFSDEKATDNKFILKLLAKLQEADEKNDEKASPTPMSPIIPSAHQRVSIAYIDDDKNGEPDYVLLPYCINGSYFDQDPFNNTVQVGLKYALITKSDLALKAAADRPPVQTRLGLWKWQRPTEILISFSDNPGPDIVFYDLGKVVKGIIIDPEPDGEFDKYEFLY